jgi:hypothetical protein
LLDFGHCHHGCQECDANQKWSVKRLDDGTIVLKAFSVSSHKRALHAANSVDLCSCAVFGYDAVEQPGALLVHSDSRLKPTTSAESSVCVACSRHNETQQSRSRNDVQVFNGVRTFVCHSGSDGADIVDANFPNVGPGGAYKQPSTPLGTHLISFFVVFVNARAYIQGTLGLFPSKFS